MSIKANVAAGLAAFAIACALCPAPVFAAQQDTNDNHTDTEDYCLRAHDVSVGLVELNACANDADRQALILDTAMPRVLVRDNTRQASEWIELDRAQLRCDFSAFALAESADGYPVVLTAPAITDVQSSVTFRVYVKDDTPKPVVAILHFAGTDIPDMTVDFSSGSATVRYSDLPVPTSQGKVFSGWYLDEKGTKPYLLPDNEAYSEQLVTADTTLYPKFDLVPVPTPVPEANVGEESEPETWSPVSVQEEQSAVVELHPVKQEAGLTVSEARVPVADSTMDDVIPPISEEGHSNIAAFVGLVAMAASASVLYTSILSDMRVLKWYRCKKEAWKARI